MSDERSICDACGEYADECTCKPQPPAPASGSAVFVTIRELWIGDRFRSGERLWTYLGGMTARLHGQESIKLAQRGYGYIGDTICSFDGEDRVEFVPPNAQPVP